MERWETWCALIYFASSILKGSLHMCVLLIYLFFS